MLEIVPFEGFGNVSFGMNRELCRANLGSSYRSFARTGGSYPETDSFDKLGVQLAFDDAGLLEFIEVFEPFSPTYKGVILLGVLDSVVQDLATVGVEGVRDSVGYDFREHGFGLYARFESVEAVSAHRRGYYEQFSAPE